MNWQQFFAMGGYAFYVWTSYGVALIVLVALVAAPVIQRKLFLRRLANKQKRSKEHEAHT